MFKFQRHFITSNASSRFLKGKDSSWSKRAVKDVYSSFKKSSSVLTFLRPPNLIIQPRNITYYDAIKQTNLGGMGPRMHRNHYLRAKMGSNCRISRSNTDERTLYVLRLEDGKFDVRFAACLDKGLATVLKKMKGNKPVDLEFQIQVPESLKYESKRWLATLLALINGRDRIVVHPPISSIIILRFGVKEIPLSTSWKTRFCSRCMGFLLVKPLRKWMQGTWNRDRILSK